MGLYSGGLIIGRIFASEIWWGGGGKGGKGHYFSGGLIFGGLIIGISRYPGVHILIEGVRRAGFHCFLNSLLSNCNGTTLSIDAV